jgi:hypothetical protein
MNSTTEIDPSELKKKLEYEERVQKATEKAQRRGKSIDLYYQSLILTG